jgi:hypothetical protein
LTLLMNVDQHAALLGDRTPCSLFLVDGVSVRTSMRGIVGAGH